MTCRRSRAHAMPDAPSSCQRPAALRLAERRPEVPLLSVPYPSGSTLANAPEGVHSRRHAAFLARREHAGARGRAAGVADAPGLGPRRAGQHGRTEPRQKACSEHFSRFVSFTVSGYTTSHLTKHRSRRETEQFQSAQVSSWTNSPSSKASRRRCRMINVDTDMIIPKQYLKTIKRTGLGKGLFSEKRYQRRRQREPRLRAQQAGLSQGQDPGRRRQFRLRLLARACAVGAAWISASAA